MAVVGLGVGVRVGLAVGVAVEIAVGVGVTAAKEDWASVKVKTDKAKTKNKLLTIVLISIPE